jgi:hypothetical protein
MVFKRFGQILKMKTRIETEETPEGEMLAFRFTMDNPPLSSATTRGTVKGDELVLETMTGTARTTKRLPWNKSIKSPAYQDRLFREQPMEPGEERSYRAFAAELGQIATVTIKAGKKSVSVELLHGAKQDLQEVEITQSILPGIATKAYLNQQGEALKTITPFLGGNLITYLVSRDEALKEIVGSELDLAVETLVKVKPIPDAHRTKRIVYRIKIRGEDPAKFLPTGSTQQLKQIDPDTVELTVTAAPPAKGATGTDGKSVAAEFRTPTRFLQSDDAEVIKLADAAVGKETDPWKRALALERFVNEKLTKKNFSTALGSAAEVARSLEGDCTEHACLLAAMARSRGIPSRVAVGLVYAQSLSAFGGHMWTEVFLDGRWIPLDATLALGGIGAGHIKLADSSFADDGPMPVASFLPLMTALGKIQIEVTQIDPQ